MLSFIQEIHFFFMKSVNLLSGHANTSNNGISVTSLDNNSLFPAWSIIFCAFSHYFSFPSVSAPPPTFNTLCHGLSAHISDYSPFAMLRSSRYVSATKDHKLKRRSTSSNSRCYKQHFISVLHHLFYFLAFGI